MWLSGLLNSMRTAGGAVFRRESTLATTAAEQVNNYQVMNRLRGHPTYMEAFTMIMTVGAGIGTGVVYVHRDLKEQINGSKKEMDAGFKRVDDDLKRMNEKMEANFQRVDVKFDRMNEKMEANFQKQNESTLRMYELMLAQLQVVGNPGLKDDITSINQQNKPKIQ